MLFCPLIVSHGEKVFIWNFWKEVRKSITARYAYKYIDIDIRVHVKALTLEVTLRII